VRSRAENRRRIGRLASAFVIGALLAVAVPRLLVAAPSGGRPGEQEVAGAIETLKADPNLATEGKRHILQWAGASKSRPAPRAGWMQWIVDLFAWIAEAPRALLWVAAAFLTALLAWYIVGLRAGAAGVFGPPSVPPTHVQDLDIRPESLPDDIGGAAFALWDRGEARAALALLYRGMLSRLAHAHGIPIRHSSTEGDCLALAAPHLRDDRTAYVSRVVSVWRYAVYGGIDPTSDEVRGLCEAFGATLDPAPDRRAAGAPA
jgi:uncharacterized protein DUF4129